MAALLKRSLALLVLSLLGLTLLAPPLLPAPDAWAQAPTEAAGPLAYLQYKVTAADGASEDMFGYAVALDGDTALVGAYGDDVVSSDQGSAYLYVRSGAIWSLQQVLTAADGEIGDQFGYAVALAGDTALVGVPWDDVGDGTDQGSAYVFTRSGTTWTQQAHLTAADGAAYDWFGNAVALDGDTALVGAPRDSVGSSDGQGSAYVFTRSGTTWSQQAQLTAATGAAGDDFGWAVALAGDTAVVGAPYAEVGDALGSAYVFTRTGVAWSQQAELAPAGSPEVGYFGWAVAVSGDTALVGSPGDMVGDASSQGAAYVFARSGTAWGLPQRLTAADGAEYDEFGIAVAVSGDAALVGAYAADVAAQVDQGAAYLYARGGAAWHLQEKLLAADGAAEDFFGWAVAVSGDTALVGAYGDDSGANSEQGAAYLFTGSAPAVFRAFLPLVGR